MADALVIAVVGAESTGKTALCRELAGHLAATTGRRCTWVPEALRDWCQAQGRTPRRHEQAVIADAQTARIDEAAAVHDVVVADTTAVMTAVYSQIVFGDASLHAAAALAHRRCQVTLLTALDLPWVADGLQRDGPQVQEPVDTALRKLLLQHGIGFSLVHGHGPLRLRTALVALSSWLGPVADDPDAATRHRRWRQLCERCSDPACEHASLLSG
ncbi:MAG: hypothetical protein RJA10_1642 [Pseudomonadota bacterium]|jgi:nicotinamide riboside kinase